MRELAGRAYFLLCLALGRLLRLGRYSTTHVGDADGELVVRKRRRFYAPLLVRMGGPVMRILDTGVRVLPQREWEEREELIYSRLRAASIRIDAGGTLVLPCLPGETLAALLEDRELAASSRKRAIELAVIALTEFHQQGFTHGDAMADNVLIDLEAGVARWFDFETMHEASRSMAWRRADDVRALLATCLVRTPSGNFAETLQLILNAYPEEEVIRCVAPAFATIWRRPLTFHLGQAGLSLGTYREIGPLLGERPPSVGPALVLPRSGAVAGTAPGNGDAFRLQDDPPKQLRVDRDDDSAQRHQDCADCG